MTSGSMDRHVADRRVAVSEGLPPRDDDPYGYFKRLIRLEVSQRRPPICCTSA